MSIAAPLGAAAPATPDGEARRILEASAEALAATRAIAYDFAYGHPEDPTGWATGRTWMRQVTDPNDSWIRVEGTIHAQPAFGAAETRFAYATDGVRAWEVNHTARTFATAPVGAGGNALAWNAVYGFVTEFVEPRPLWKELGTARSVRLLGTETVDGEVCDIVQALFARDAGGAMDLRWSIARSDRLPRRGRWITAASGPEGVTFAFTDLRVERDLARARFALEAPAGYRTVEAASPAGVGKPLPDVTLRLVDGDDVGTLRMADLRGSVAVLDFWNTWCFICRAIAPQTRALHAELAPRGVRFFGVNVFETGDPLAYWREERVPYPMLLDGDELARALDLPWQPGVAVVDARGEVVFTELGGSDDRADRVRAAARRALLAAGRAVD